MEELDKESPTQEEWLEIPFEAITEKPKRELKRKIKQEYNESPIHTSYYMPTKQRSNVDIEDRRKDEYSTFGEYIANKLRKVKSPRTRGNIQQIITTVLWQAESGAYDHTDSVKNLFFANITPIVNATAMDTSYNNEENVQDTSTDSKSETLVESLQ